LNGSEKLFFGLRREMNKLGGMPVQLNSEAAKTIASSMGVASREVIEMDCRLRGDVSLNKPINDEGQADGGQAVEWEATLVDPAPGAEAILAEREEDLLQKKALYEAINVLTRRECQVFEARRLARKPLTLDQLAQEFSISAERVRQIEAQAFAKVKQAARNRIGAVRSGKQLAKSYLSQWCSERGDA
jgi:RNA polymerase sigma-32 factor